MAAQPDKTIDGNLGYALDALGRSDEAYERFKVVETIDPRDPQIRYNIGTYLLQHGKVTEAIAELETALRFASIPQVISYIHNNLGTAYLQLGDYPAAEQHYTAALQIDDQRLHSLIGRGQALYAQGKFAAAAGDFARALEIAGPDPQLRLLYGKALAGEKKFDEALAAYSAALQQDPNLSEAQAAIAALRKQMRGGKR